jgi:hypothetical protein
MPLVEAAVAVYIAGLGVALWRTDAPLPARLLLAAFWPLGPLAFLVTVSVLLAASLIAFPAFAAGVALSGAVAWWVWWSG